jgi:hypothetical protein
MFAARVAPPQRKAAAPAQERPHAAAVPPPVPIRREDERGAAATDLSKIPPSTIQRAAIGSEDGVPDDHVPDSGGPVDAALSARINAARGGGRALPPATRSRMERLLGNDLTGVRVHDDLRSHELNLSLNARAFTIGGDVFLGKSAGIGDARLMAHELTHVVQQRGMHGAGALTLAAPGTVHEREADTNAALSSSTAVSANAGPARVSGHSSAIQRFQFGERGHGGIEERGLKKAHFEGDMGKGEIGAIYFGNWLRDWSQVSPGVKSPIVNALVFKLLNILSWGEFNRPLDPAQLGGYVPSEHMDNPLGGKTIEATGAANPADNATPAQFSESFGGLSKDQQAEYAGAKQPQAQSALGAASLTSGLPDYIERSKAHVRGKLEQAVRQGRTPAGMLSFGDALHGIEDYYAHSNFTEIALAQLAAENNEGAGKVLAAAKQEGFDATSVAAVGADPLKRGAALITGTVGDQSDNANKAVSLIEALRSEVLTGALRRAFVLGVARTGGTGLLGAAGKLLGGLVGGVLGGIAGLASDVASGIGNLFSPGRRTKGFGSGIKSGIARGAHAGGEVGQRIGDFIEGAVAAVAVGSILAVIVTPILAIYTAIKNKPSKVAALTRASAKGAPEGKPTHSQISKDAPEHPVFKAASALAEHADEVFGTAMIAAWKNPDKDAAVKSVVSLVDKYVAYPDSTNRPLWEPTLLGAVGSNGKKKTK